jgi:hypothetical protein
VPAGAGEQKDVTWPTLLQGKLGSSTYMAQGATGWADDAAQCTPSAVHVQKVSPAWEKVAQQAQLGKKRRRGKLVLSIQRKDQLLNLDPSIDQRFFVHDYEQPWLDGRCTD